MFLLFRFDVFAQNPLEIIDTVVINSGQKYYYTNLEQSVTKFAPRPAMLFHDGTPSSPVGESGPWLPLAIKSTSPTLTAEQRPSDMKIDIPTDCPIAVLFRSGHPNASVWLTVYICADEQATPMMIGCGSVRGAVTHEFGVTLQVMPLQYMLQRPAARGTFSRQCPHVLYGTMCGISRQLYRVVGEVASLSEDGLTLTLNNFVSPVLPSNPGGSGGPVEDGFLTGGHVVVGPTNYSAASTKYQYAPAFGGHKRMILTHVGNTLTLMSPLFEAPVGTPVIAYRGCAKTLAACQQFQNVRRFGGFPHVPLKDPFAEGLG